jgi:PBP1b-binding outer membrane lipoprotein LpoB
MIRNKFVTTAILVIVMVISACSGKPVTVTSEASQEPTVPIETLVAEAFAGTSAAQTAIANAVAATLTSMATNTPEIPMVPSHTPTVTYTPSPSIPMVSVSSATNCRSGPDTNYPLLGILKVGESAQVVGRNIYNDTWIIKLPSNPTTTCWLWGQYATAVGDIAGVPIIPNPATPVPQASLQPDIRFHVVYWATSRCDGNYELKFKITNTGILTWESNSVYAKDLVTNEERSTSYDSFPDVTDNCSLASDDLSLEQDEIGITTSGEFTDNPAGHVFTATIRLCSQNGLGGTCRNETLKFTP